MSGFKVKLPSKDPHAQPVGEGMGHPPRQCLRLPSQDFGEAKRSPANLLLQSMQEIEQEYQGDCHGLVPDWHGALICESAAAPVETWSPLDERKQIFCVTGFWLQRRDPSLQLDRKAVQCGLPIADQLRARRDRPRATPIRTRACSTPSSSQGLHHENQHSKPWP